MFKDLQGKKTYILAFIAILSAWGAYWAGTMDLQAAIAATFAALGGITIRAGITTEASKVANPKPVPTEEEKKVLEKFKGSGLGLALLFCLFFLPACSTGIGRATSLAFNGVPPEVASSLDAIEAEYDIRANYEMKDIVAAEPATPEGLLRQETARVALQERIDIQHELIQAVRDYIGVEKAASPTATSDAAVKNRTALLDAVLEKIATQKLKSTARASGAINTPVK